MRTIRFRSLATLVVGCLALCFSLNAFAGPATPGDLLVQAYATLDRADHDYKGHRIAAMKQIQAAVKLVHVKLRGDGKGHEKQGISDEQLRTAQGLLEQARTGLSRRPLRHVNKALQQLSIALKIK